MTAQLFCWQGAITLRDARRRPQHRMVSGMTRHYALLEAVTIAPSINPQIITLYETMFP
jgi:hypothetical protein